MRGIGALNQQAKLNQPVAVKLDLIYETKRQLIEAAKNQVVVQFNQVLTLSYWQAGKPII